MQRLFKSQCGRGIDARWPLGRSGAFKCCHTQPRYALNGPEHGTLNRLKRERNIQLL